MLVGGWRRQIRATGNTEKRLRRGTARGSVANPKRRLEKLLASPEVSVPQSDTGRRAEDAQGSGRTLVKELGKIAP
jgi:hypothetical protein